MKFNYDEFGKYLERLNGAEIRGLSGGPLTGSSISLEFATNVSDSMEAAILRRPCFTNRHRPEMSLMIWCSWRLEEGDQILTSSAAEIKPDGSSIRAIRRIVGQKVRAIGVERPSFDMTMRIEEAFVLRVFCDEVNDNYSNYNLHYQEGSWTVGTRSALRFVPKV